MEELDRLLAEDSPRGEELRTPRDSVRTTVFGPEPLCEDCREGGESDDDREPQKDH